MKNEHTSALCPACGSDCNERDELEKAKREINRLRAEPLKMQRDWRRAMQIDDAREFIKFLHGAVPWNGTWFGEYAPGERGAYWWRKHLDEAIAALIAAPAAPQQAEPVAWMAFGGALVHAVTRNAMDPIEAERFDVPLYLHPPAAPQQAGQFDHLAGRGMHELRFDELTPYVLSLLAGRGQDTPDVRIALDWIVAELERKTNDERALAVKLDAIRAAPQQAEPVEIVPRVWRETLRKLTFMARTSGGTPGPDEGLQTACAEAETLLSKPYNYPPAAPQQAEPVAWMKPTRDSCYLRSAETMLAIHEDFDGIARTGWTPLYLHPPAAEVQRLREALKPFAAIDLTTNQAVDAMDVLRARRALEGGE